MAKITLDTNLIEDPATYRLAGLLEITRRQTIGHLAALYLWAADYAYDGMLIAYNRTEIAKAALYPGDPECFENAMEESGWYTDHYHTLRDWNKVFTPGTSGRLEKDEWRAIRRRILARDNYICHYCERPIKGRVAHVDHIVPIAEGGTNDFFNLVASCRDCNLAKGTKTYKEFQWSRGVLIL